MQETPNQPPLTNFGMLTHSTWLVLGCWLIYTGVELIFSLPPGNAPFAYFIAALRISVGAFAIKSATAVARLASNPNGSPFRVLTGVLVMAIFGFPLLLFIFQTWLILYGKYNAGEHYRQNVIRLLIVSVGYLCATIFAGRRHTN